MAATSRRLVDCLSRELYDFSARKHLTNFDMTVRVRQCGSTVYCRCEAELTRNMRLPQATSFCNLFKLGKQRPFLNA